jgi:hypothetical protein
MLKWGSSEKVLTSPMNSKSGYFSSREVEMSFSTAWSVSVTRSTAGTKLVRG